MYTLQHPEVSPLYTQRYTVVHTQRYTVVHTQRYTRVGITQKYTRVVITLSTYPGGDNPQYIPGCGRITQKYTRVWENNQRYTRVVNNT